MRISRGKRRFEAPPLPRFSYGNPPPRSNRSTHLTI